MRTSRMAKAPTLLFLLVLLTTPLGATTADRFVSDFRNPVPYLGPVAVPPCVAPAQGGVTLLGGARNAYVDNGGMTLSRASYGQMTTSGIPTSISFGGRSEPLQRYGLGSLRALAVRTIQPEGGAATTLVVSAGGNGLTIWDGERNELLRVFDQSDTISRSIAISPDGSYFLLGGANGFITQVDGRTGERIRTYRGHTGAVTALAISDDGAQAFSGGEDRTVRTWDVDTCQSVALVGTVSEAVRGLSHSPDQNRLAVTDGNSIRIWNLIDLGADSIVLSGHSDNVTSLAFSPDGTRLASGSTDGTAVLWIWRTSTPTPIDNDGVAVLAVAYSPDGSKVLLGSGNNRGREFSAGAPPTLLRELPGHEGAVNHVAYAGESGRVLTASGRELITGDLSPGDARILSFPAGLTAGEPLDGHQEKTAAIALSTNGDITFTAGADGRLRRFDTATGRSVEVDLLGKTNAPINAMAFLAGSGDPATERLIVAAGVELSTWRATREVRNTSGEVTATFPAQVLAANSTAHAGVIADLWLDTARREVVTGASDGSAKLWSIPVDVTGAPTVVTSVPMPAASAVTAVALSTDGQQIVTASSDRVVRWWPRAGGTVPQRELTLPVAVNDLTISDPTKQPLLAAAGADGNVYLIGATDTPTLLRGHNRALRSVAYSTSGLYLISGGDDTTVIAWDVARQAQRGRFRRHTGAVAALQFAQVDTRFVSGGADGQAFLWDSGLESQGRLEDKLIIVAGGGDYALNPIKDETFNLAQRAYTIARTRGYSDSNILYLSSYWDSPSRQDALAGKADGPATRDSIREGITEWSGDARRLFVMFLDHGEREAQQPSGEMEWFFLIAERTNPGGGVVRERVSATEVDTWLDQVQGGLDPLPDAILYADMCYAGGFVKRASAAPGTAGRTVIASTGEDRLAVFGGGASAPLSFTSFFLSAAHLGNNLADSFSTARETMSNLRIPKDRPQSPELDSDGDGVYTGLDVPKARDRGFVLGNRLAYGLTPPIITNAAAIAPIIAPVAVPVELQLTGEVQRAEVFIVFADTDYGNQIDPVSNFQSITLARQGISSRWRGTIPANTFTAEGDYTVFYSVSRTDTLESNIDLFAQPQVSTIRFDSTPQTILPHGWTLQ